ncbi:MAG: GNAT family N-acetyltransferase [Candidatus Heimdallarchaeota archaeon]
MSVADYKIVNITDQNVENYDLLCYKSKKKSLGYLRKLEWFKEQYKAGLRIKLLLVRERKGLTSRGFIEYVPGEYSWRAIDAAGYMVIHCLWVVGRNKGKGYGRKLIKECLNDAKDMNGVAVVTSEGTWLPGRKIFEKSGFEKVESVFSDIELYVYRFSENSALPRFNLDKFGKANRENGFVIFKSNQCPYTYASMNEIEEYAKEKDIPLEVSVISSSSEAQNVPHPYGTYCVVLDGQILSYRPIGKKGLQKMDLRQQSTPWD